MNAADADDIYIEGHLSFGNNDASRTELGGVVGYLPWDEIGLGLFSEQHLSRDLGTTDSSAFRSGLELRWFQEPFEIAGSVGWMLQNMRDGSQSHEITLGVESSYLFAITPSVAAMARFNFLFLDEIGALFYYGIGFRILY